MAKKPFHAGRFIPQNPQKYVGNPKNIMFRSSWERTFMVWLDKNNAVLRWGSEELYIPFVNPIDNKVHKYYPDMVIMYINNSGQVKKEIIEIKPYKQTIITPKMTDQEKLVVIVNQAKWKYASEWAQRNGASFRILTEKSMYLQKPKKEKGTAL